MVILSLQVCEFFLRHLPLLDFLQVIAPRDQRSLEVTRQGTYSRVTVLKFVSRRVEPALQLQTGALKLEVVEYPFYLQPCICYHFSSSTITSIGRCPGVLVSSPPLVEATIVSVAN